MTVFDRADDIVSLHVQPGERPVRGVVDLVGGWGPWRVPARPTARDGAKMNPAPANGGETEPGRQGPRGDAVSDTSGEKAYPRDFEPNTSHANAVALLDKSETGPGVGARHRVWQCARPPSLSPSVASSTSASTSTRHRSTGLRRPRLRDPQGRSRHHAGTSREEAARDRRRSTSGGDPRARRARTRHRAAFGRRDARRRRRVACRLQSAR